MKKLSLLLVSLLMQVGMATVASAQDNENTVAIADGIGARQTVYLPEGLTGKGVLVGVIDGGMEFNHVNFLDPKTFQTRIKTAFLVNPDGSYVVARTPEEIAKLDHSLAHGTHVAGIAAGSYAADGWHGIAPEADLCLAAVTDKNNGGGETSTPVALKNVFAVADSLGLPVVVNLSIGPAKLGDDGYRDLVYRFEELTEMGNLPGHIVVVSSANKGNSTSCLEGTIGSDGKLHVAFADPTVFRAGDAITIGFSLETPKGEDLNFRFYLYDAVTKKEVNEDLLDDMGNPMDFSALVQDVTNSENDKSPYRYYKYSYPSFVMVGRDDVIPCLEITGNAGTKISYITDVVLIEDDDRFANVNKVYSPKNALSMTPAVISVGNYDARVPGKTPIRKDSSFGLNRFGDKIPDVVAPGTGIISSTMLTKETGDKYASREIKMPDGNAKTFMWQTMTGTSQSSPLMAGIVALMLQYDPTLTVNRVRELLYDTNDWNEDCDNAPMGPNQAGHGILNTKALFEKLMGSTAIKEVPARPTNDAIYDLFGRRLSDVPEKGIFIRNNKKIIK